MIAAHHPLDDLAWSSQQKHDMSCHDDDYDDDDDNLATMEIRMTANNIVRTARTVRTTACVSQESWTAGNQCLSASCLDGKKLIMMTMITIMVKRWWRWWLWRWRWWWWWLWRWWLASSPDLSYRCDKQLPRGLTPTKVPRPSLWNNLVNMIISKMILSALTFKGVNQEVVHWIQNHWRAQSVSRSGAPQSCEMSNLFRKSSAPGVLGGNQKATRCTRCTRSQNAIRCIRRQPVVPRWQVQSGGQ